jgi:hypothetical protein
MATVLDKCPTEEQRSVVRFLWGKGLNAKNIYKKKECILFTMGSFVA